MQVNLEAIKALRNKAKKSQEEMAVVLGHKSLWSYWRQESGQVPFTAEQLYKIAKLFSVPIESLFFEEEFAKKAK